MADGGVYARAGGKWERIGSGGSGGGLDVPATRDDAVLQVKETAGEKSWVEGMALSIVDEVPADTDGEIGDVVFVLGDDPKDQGGGLEGLPDWAEITAMTGDPKRYDYTADDVAWAAFEWTGDGSVTTSGGLVDLVLVGPGGGNATSGPGGCGGEIVYGLNIFNGGDHQVIIEPYSSNSTTQTMIEGPTNIRSGLARRGSSNALGTYRPSDDDLTAGKGAFFSYITGTKEYYGIAEDSSGSKPNNPEYPQTIPARPNKGDGGGYGASSWNRPGTAGCVIVRVPASKVSANGGWV